MTLGAVLCTLKNKKPKTEGQTKNELKETKLKHFSFWCFHYFSNRLYYSYLFSCIAGMTGAPPHPVFFFLIG
jgi:hypothetical protein